MPNHLTLTFCCCEGAMYHVAIATVLFSEDIMFSRESSPGISLVFI